MLLFDVTFRSVTAAKSKGWLDGVLEWCEPNTAVLKANGAVIAKSSVSKEDLANKSFTMQKYNIYLGEAKNEQAASKDHMSVSRWEVKYTVKSELKWFSGTFVHLNNKFTLLDSRGSQIDNVCCSNVKAGDEITCEKHLVQIVGPLRARPVFRAPLKAANAPILRFVCANVSRKIKIPNAFASAAEYRKTFKAAIIEHLQILVSECASVYFKSLKLLAHKALLNDCALLKSELADSGFALFSDCLVSENTLSVACLDLSNVDDLWVLSSTSSFTNPVFFRSCTSSSSVSRIDLCPLDCKTKIDATCTFFALRVASNCNELTQLSLLDSEFDFPLFQRLLNPVSEPCSVNPDKLFSEKAQQLCAKHLLNTDQTKVVMAFANDISISGTSVTLVHGVFGSGKSFLAALLVLFVASVSEFRLLIASNTNVAVDRILSCLLDLEFTAFVRVGSKKRMDAKIAQYAAHDSTDAQSISRFNIVAATCLATMMDCMAQQKFDLVLLDECSQFTEPMALLPLRLGAKHVVCIGDPKQLPPTIQTRALHSESLEKTLFERLNNAGVKPHVLKTQYRCPEQIAALASRLFYDSTLVTGSLDASPLPGFKPLCFIDVDGTETSMGQSYINTDESKIITRLYQLISATTPATEIGIITPYKAQAAKIAELIANDDTLVSTVDAFQGSEKSIILVSCVRSSSIGFSDDPRRLNVLLTRAKANLIIIGNSKLLMSSALWNNVISACELESTASVWDKFCVKQIAQETHVKRPRIAKKHENWRKIKQVFNF